MMYRAHYALPNLRNSHNQPTGATFGTLTMLRRLASDYPTSCRACIFDAKGTTFRNRLYAEYKAQRPPMPEDLASQIPLLHQCIRALGWPLIIAPDVEADDVIATLTRQAQACNWQVLVATKDKDLAQLVSPSTSLVNDRHELMDEAGVMAKYGVPPARIVDYLALMGDASDNVPGVPKIGPKTASRLLMEYGDLDNLMARAGEVKGVVGENLRNSLGLLSLSRQLVQLKHDVPLRETLEDLRPKPEDNEALKTLFATLGFRTWLKQLQAGQPDTEAAASSTATISAQAISLVHDQDTLAQWLKRLMAAPLSALSIAATSQDPMTASIANIAWTTPADGTATLTLGADFTVEMALSQLAVWLSSSQPKVGNNLKFAAHVLANHGVQLAGMAHDTLLQSYVLESHMNHSLEALCQRNLGEEMPADASAARIAPICLRLHDQMWPRLQSQAGPLHIYQHIEMPLLPVLLVMERSGVLLDAAQLEAQSQELGERLLILEQEMAKLAGTTFNPNSPKQIQEVFFGRLGLPVLKKTAKGDPSTDEEVLEQLALDHPMAKMLLEHRMLAKLKNTYTEKLPPLINAHTGRLHTQFSQAVAVTGRLASQHPNLQNIPIRTPQGRRVRQAFVAPEGCCLLSADYSQIELRIMAHLSGDEGLCAAFRAGEDVHRRTAAELFGVAPDQVDELQRRSAKIINFGLIYGMTTFGLARQLNLSQSAAEIYMNRYFARYPGVAAYMENTRKNALSQGFVETVFGRRLYFPAGSGRRPALERAAINAPMQGTAADLIKMAMIAVSQQLTIGNYKTRLLMQVHDELVLEVPDDERDAMRELVAQAMVGVAELAVPLEVDVGMGENWDQAH